MKKKVIALIILLSVLLIGCSGNNDSPHLTFEIDRFEYIEKIDECELVNMHVIRDRETGVNYIVADGYKTVTMCPLYDSEGDVVVTEKKGD